MTITTISLHQAPITTATQTPPTRNDFPRINLPIGVPPPPRLGMISPEYMANWRAPAPTSLDTPLPRHLEALWAWGPGAEAMPVVRRADRAPRSFRDLAISNLEDGGSLNDIQHA